MKFLRRRLLHALVVLVTVSAVTFAMVGALPGDAALVLAGADASPEDVAATRAELGLDAGVAQRYLHWLGGALQGDLGRSLLTREPVWDVVIARLPVTLELLLLAQCLALGFAVPAAVASARRPDGRWDRWLGAAGFATLSVPSFVMAILLIFVFALQLRWLPATGFAPLAGGLGPNLRSMLLPSLSIALVEWVPLARVLRSDLIATLREDFVTLARSKGLGAGEVLLRHCLRPASLTMMTVVGLQLGHLIGGAVVVESVFALPGVGRLLLDAIYGRDFLVVQGCVLWIAIGYLTIHLLVDLLYSLLDPRIRREAAID